MNSSNTKKIRFTTGTVTRGSSGARTKRGSGDIQKKSTIPPKKDPTLLYNSKKSNRYFILFFFLFAVILYGNTVLNKWAVDDNFVTGPQNELVKKGFGAIPTIFTSFYLVNKGNIGVQQSEYRPIVKMTFAIEYGLWGGKRAGVSHFINLLIYFCIITLLFFILRRLLRDYNILFPFLITVLFMAHPIHTEVVASLKNRDELLSFLCGLGGLHFFLRYADTKKSIYISAALLVFFIGYLSKSSILPFIALYPLVLYFFTDLKPKNFIWIFASVLLAAIIAYLVPRLFLPKPIHANAFIENPLFMEKSFWIRSGTGMMTLLFYLRILIFPHPLLFYYGFDMIPITGLGNILALFSLILHLGLFIYALRKFREKHILSFAILWYFIAIAIYSNIISPAVGIVGERFVFNASLGFIIALVYLIFRIFRTEPMSLTIEFNERAKIIVIIILLLIPCTAMTIQRNRQWRNLGSLYSADIKYQDKSVKAQIEYAKFLTEMVYKDPNYQQSGAVNQKLQQIIVSHFRAALRMYPRDYSTLNDLAASYINFSSNPDSAMFFLKKAIALRPDLQPAWVNMAMAYRKKNQVDSAIVCYEKVLQINPGALTAVFKLADLFFEKGDQVKAMQINENVMKSYPDMDIPYFNIGYYYIRSGDTTTAIRYWEQAAQRNATYEVCYNLSMMFKAKGIMEKANYYHNLAVDALKARRNN